MVYGGKERKCLGLVRGQYVRKNLINTVSDSFHNLPGKYLKSNYLACSNNASTNFKAQIPSSLKRFVFSWLIKLPRGKKDLKSHCRSQKHFRVGMALYTTVIGWCYKVLVALRSDAFNLVNEFVRYCCWEPKEILRLGKYNCSYNLI